MGAPLLVVVLVAAGDTTDPGTTALTATAEDALEGNAIVVVRQAETARLTDAEADKVAAAVRADAVVVVTWSPFDRRRALVRVHAGKREAWVDRTLSFEAEDPVAERGRTVGFEIASMLRVRVPEAPATEPALAPPPAMVPEVRRGPTLAVDAVALLGMGGVGGEGAARWFFSDTVTLRIGGGWRGEPLRAVSGDASVTRFGAGIAWRGLDTGGPRPIAVGARVDLLAIQHSVSRTRKASSDARWLPGADFVLEGSWVFAPGFAAIAGPGVEVSFGTTRVLVDGAQVTTIPSVRFVSELGLRFAF
jgi:hypothetical protein